MIDDFYKLANEAFDAGNYEKAIEYYDKLIFYNGDEAEVYNLRGLAKYNLEKYEEAIKDFNTALKLDNNNADIYYNKGLTEYDMGDYE